MKRLKMFLPAAMLLLAIAASSFVTKQKLDPVHCDFYFVFTGSPGGDEFNPVFYSLIDTNVDVDTDECPQSEILCRLCLSASDVYPNGTPKVDQFTGDGDSDPSTLGDRIQAALTTGIENSEIWLKADQ